MRLHTKGDSLLNDVEPLKRLSRWLKADDRVRPLSAPEAFSALYQQAHLFVYRYTFGLLGGSQEEAEDLTAETFIRAWKARGHFQGDDKAAIGWLLHIARRLVIDHYRRNRVRQAFEAAPSDEIPDLQGLPEEQVIVGEQHQTLLTLLQFLPVEPREMLVLRYILGWQVKTIAEHLEKSENTVSVSIRRALQRLQREWPQPEEE